MNQNFREIAVVAICGFIAGCFGCWNALLEMEVLDLVNTKLPPEKQYALFWYPYWEVRKAYKEIFPGGTLLRKADKVKRIALGVFFGGIILQFLLNRAFSK